MTSRYRGENAVPFSLKGVGIAPTIELSVVIGMGIPVLSFPRFHGFRQTNRTSWFAIYFPPAFLIIPGGREKLQPYVEKSVTLFLSYLPNWTFIYLNSTIDHFRWQ